MIREVVQINAIALRAIGGSRRSGCGRLRGFLPGGALYKTTDNR